MSIAKLPLPEKGLSSISCTTSLGTPNSLKGGASEIEDGVKTIHRSDYNFDEVSDTIRDTILKFSQFDKKQVNAARKNAEKVAEKALWKHFITYYYEAYKKALTKRDERIL